MDLVIPLTYRLGSNNSHHKVQLYGGRKQMAEMEISSGINFNNVIEKGIALIDFNAPWCAPCRAQGPVIKELVEKFKGKATIAMVNIDDNRDIALHLGIQSIPTLIIFKEGKELVRLVGLQSSESLSKALENVID